MTATVFRDLLLILLLGFMFIIVVLLSHINPPGKEARTTNPEPQGNVVVEIFWPDAWDTDVDLWVKAPGDVPVGYSNKGGVIFNLLRDDLGMRADATPHNQEIAVARGTPPGEWVVNIHLYRNTERKLPVPVVAVVSTRKKETLSLRQILATEVNLTRDGQELTVFRFKLDEAGELVPGSVHNLQQPLRSWRPLR